MMYDKEWHREWYRKRKIYFNEHPDEKEIALERKRVNQNRRYKMQKFPPQFNMKGELVSEEYVKEWYREFYPHMAHLTTQNLLFTKGRKENEIIQQYYYETGELLTYDEIEQRRFKRKNSDQVD